MPERIEFSRSLYAPEAVREAIAAYAGLGRFSFEETEGELSVLIEDPHPDIQDLADHFANHALYATITMRRRSIEGAA